jgi:peptidoglycan hydrolase-like protein with peptidoglycan-binding domain
MNRIKGTILGAIILSGFLCLPMIVMATDTPSEQELIQQLQQQVEQLKAQIQSLQTQIDALNQAKQELKETAGEVKGTLQLLRQLKYGMSGEDIKLLQEILATDPSIYPEGLTTGYFGSLTKNAIKKFQKKACIDQTGTVGPTTLWRINELLTEGAGKLGKVPPGLLTAPGIQKKLCQAPSSEDKTAPVITEITATDITSASAKITWLTDENADSKVWYGTVTPLVVTDSTLKVSSSDLVKNHTITLSGLDKNTTYYYIVSSTDAAGNNTKGAEKSFVTITTEQSCVNSGGTVKTSSCCLSVNDFPNSCLVGACGCAVADSHDVKTCDCGQDKCFDGNKCVPK